MQKAWQGKRVLVVDDIASSRQQIVQVCQSIGLNVVGTAQDGLQALDMAEQLRPDIISLDIIMPVMDGMECYNILRTRFPHIMVFFVTALASEQTVVAHFTEQIAAERFIPKPLRADVLEARLTAFMDKTALPAGGTTPHVVNEPAIEL